MGTTQYLREVRSHKVILCHASKFFKAMCGSVTTASEFGQDVIYLEDDDCSGDVRAER
jgi:hypothetical protein